MLVVDKMQHYQALVVRAAVVWVVMVVQMVLVRLLPLVLLELLILAVAVEAALVLGNMDLPLAVMVALV
jgi:hypothetical protein